MDIDVNYSDDNEEKLKEYFEWQEVVKKDLERIRYKILECKDSDSKDKLLSNIDRAICDLPRNRFEGGTVMDLDIKAYDNCLVFSYWKIATDGGIALDSPSIVIITRDMKSFYFIDEVKYIKRVVDENDYDNEAISEIQCFVKDKNEIKNYNVNKTMRTGDLYYDCFNRTKSFIKELI